MVSSTVRAVSAMNLWLSCPFFHAASATVEVSTIRQFFPAKRKPGKRCSCRSAKTYCWRWACTSVQLLRLSSAKILQHCKSSYLYLVRCMDFSSKVWGFLQRRTTLQLPAASELSPRRQYLSKIVRHYAATQSSVMHPDQLPVLF